MASIRITLTDDEERSLTKAMALYQQRQQRDEGEGDPNIDAIEQKIGYARQVAGNTDA